MNEVMNALINLSYSVNLRMTSSTWRKTYFHLIESSHLKI